MEICDEKSIQVMIKKIEHDPKKILYQGQDTPYEAIGDRNFEVLIYQLFKRHKVEKEKQYDRIELMSGVGEHGRDSVLYKGQEPLGIVQCKHTINRKRMTIDQAAKEVIKFIIYAIQDNKLIPAKEDINYYFVHSYGFSETAQNLLANFRVEITSDVERLKGWTESVIKSYENLRHLSYESIEDKIIKLIPRIHIFKMERQDIDLLIKTEEDILSTFFQVVKVIEKRKNLPREYEHAKPTEDEVKQAFEKNFIKKLNDIKVDKQEVFEAISDYWNTLKTLKVLNEIEYINIDVIEDYQSDLKFEYSNLYKSNGEMIKIDMKEEEIRKMSRIFYRQVMGQSPISIIDLEENRMFFQRGIYQDMANTTLIPTWKLERYQEVEDEIKSDDIIQFLKGK